MGFGWGFYFFDAIDSIAILIVDFVPDTLIL